MMRQAASILFLLASFTPGCALDGKPQPLSAKPIASSTRQDVSGLHAGDERVGAGSLDKYMSRHTSFVVSGDNDQTNEKAYVKIFVFGTKLHKMVAFLESQGISPEIDDNRHVTLYDSPQLRHALATYINILNQKMTVIANNMANINTVNVNSDPPRPFQRKILVVADDGSTRVETDDAPFPMEWRPSSPWAITEGDNKGFERRPNVDIVQEQVDAIFVMKEFEVVRDVMRQLYGRSPSGS